MIIIIDTWSTHNESETETRVSLAPGDGLKHLSEVVEAEVKRLHHEDELVRRIRQKRKDRKAKKAAVKTMEVDMDREMADALDEVLAAYSDQEVP